MGPLYRLLCAPLATITRDSPTLSRRSPCSPATAAGARLHQQLCRASGAASLASRVIATLAKGDSEKHFQWGYQRPPYLLWQYLVSTTCTHHPAPQLDVATQLLLCTHQAKPCKCNKPPTSVQAPALRSTAWTPPWLTCWKENTVFIFPSKASYESSAKFPAEDSGITEALKHQKMHVGRNISGVLRLSHNCWVNWAGELLPQQACNKQINGWMGK